MPSPNTGGPVKFWHGTGLLALLSLGYLVSEVVRSPDRTLSPDGFGGLVGFVSMAVATVLLYRRQARNSRLDHNGPVAPAEDPSVPEGTRWTLDQIASVLALHVQPMNGVVFADDRTQTIRVMVDPPSAITWNAGEATPGRTEAQRDRMRGSGGSQASPYFTGRWTIIRLHAGQLPELENRQSTVSVAYNGAGDFVPLWSPTGKGSLQVNQSVLPAAGSRTPLSFEYDSRELHRVVDSTVVRAGWASAADVAARPADPKTRHEVRRVDRTTSTATVATSTQTGERPSEAELKARLKEAHRQQIKANSSSGKELDPSKIMTLIGAVVLAGCVIGTILGLIFGMPWWASFIIIGSGLVFCAIFVLPVWLLFGKPRQAQQS